MLVRFGRSPDHELTWLGPYFDLMEEIRPSDAHLSFWYSPGSLKPKDFCRRHKTLLLVKSRCVPRQGG